MTSPRWLFVALILWILASLWSNALEPAETELLSSDITGTIEGMGDPSLASAGGAAKVWSWVTNIWKALVFDYAWFEGWAIGTILRVICIVFTIASLYFIADLIILVFRVAWAALGKFAG